MLDSMELTRAMARHSHRTLQLQVLNLQSRIYAARIPPLRRTSPRTIVFGFGGTNGAEFNQVIDELLL